MTAPQILFFKELLSTIGEKNKKEIYLWFFMKSFQIFLMSILEVKGLAKEEKVHTYAVTNLAEHAWQLITHFDTHWVERMKLF